MKNQKGSISVEYLLGTMMIVAIVFGVKVNDQNLWTMFQQAFQTRHDNYSQSINNLDSIDVGNIAINNATNNEKRVESQ